MKDLLVLLVAGTFDPDLLLHLATQDVALLGGVENDLFPGRGRDLPQSTEAAADEAGACADRRADEGSLPEGDPFEAVGRERAAPEADVVERAVEATPVEHAVPDLRIVKDYVVLEDGVIELQVGEDDQLEDEPIQHESAEINFIEVGISLRIWILLFSDSVQCIVGFGITRR